MSDLYTALVASPKKRRCPPEFDDETTLTPKKLRLLAPPTPPHTVRRAGKSKQTTSSLPTDLARLQTIQTALQHALSHALATCAVSPSTDTGIVRNVLNHYSLTTYAGLTTKFDLDDLTRLCWIWEWDADALPDPPKTSEVDADDNPFLDAPPAPQPKDWTRGAMGLVLSPCTHFSKSVGKRVPAYGIGVEVEMDIDKGMGGGMAAVARWTSEADARRVEFRRKLERWVELHPGGDPIPKIPQADLPQLLTEVKVSALTHTLASSSPKGLAILSIQAPSSPTPSSFRSPTKSPVKRSAAGREFAIPFPLTTPKGKEKETLSDRNTLTFPTTPSRRNLLDPALSLLTPKTPSIASPTSSEPSTPTTQRGAGAATEPQTPTSSRRQALYDRIRQKSLTSTPSKPQKNLVQGSKMSKDQMMRMGQEEMRRRCLLGRLSGVAESVWMLFSGPSGSGTAPTTRKRRAMPTSEIALAIIKSSPVPISSAEAHESLGLLTKLCPFFLKQLNIAGEEYLEMPAPTPAAPSGSSGAGAGASPSKLTAPPSPGPPIKSKNESADEVLNRSPRRVKQEAGGLRHVREIIRRELELQD
ncbi:hypothetical protein FIBSPDRAFT_918815 [Athelia psychrophila]|uniref:DNA replication factor Cdt1 C-terminal domain-containing protein n=1 Tax=Athelia psychrophila TaxID=1759441 RepID=A0A166N6B0_9AGAM|nr:hypothetical protein FIBSPDRAFT_918815 [Fibularhizoctonia sp. CBS 109695]